MSGAALVPCRNSTSARGGAPEAHPLQGLPVSSGRAVHFDPSGAVAAKRLPVERSNSIPEGSVP